MELHVFIMGLKLFFLSFQSWTLNFHQFLCKIVEVLENFVNSRLQDHVCKRFN